MATDMTFRLRNSDKSAIRSLFALALDIECQCRVLKVDTLPVLHLWNSFVLACRNGPKFFKARTNAGCARFFMHGVGNMLRHIWVSVIIPATNSFCEAVTTRLVPRYLLPPLKSIKPHGDSTTQDREPVRNGYSTLHYDG
jgi:hypothetical protein